LSKNDEKILRVDPRGAPTSNQDMTFEKYLNKIGKYGYENVRISNTILNLHYTFMSHYGMIFRNYLIYYNYLQTSINASH